MLVHQAATRARPRRLRRRRRRRGQDDRAARPRRRLPRERCAGARARRRAAAPPTSSPPRPASPAAPCTGSSSTPSARAASRAAACWSSTRPGMAETRVLAPLLELVEQRARGRRSWSATRTSCPPVGAGGLYPALCDRLGAIDLIENRRQRDLVRTRRARAAARRRPRALPRPRRPTRPPHLDDDATAAKQRLLEDWWQTAAARSRPAR